MYLDEVLDRENNFNDFFQGLHKQKPELEFVVRWLLNNKDRLSNDDARINYLKASALWLNCTKMVFSENIGDQYLYSIKN